MLEATTKLPRSLSEHLLIQSVSPTDPLNSYRFSKNSLPDTPPPERFDEESFFESGNQTPDPVKPSEEPLVAVIGVGYVGLHLVTAFAPVYKVVAFDISEERVKAVSQQFPHCAANITWTTQKSRLARATHFLIAVPTSLLPNKQINTSHLRDAISTVAFYARPGATVVVESSVAVGMTRQLLGPIMRQRGLKVGMSPERVDPGRTEPPMHTIPKVISGLDDIMPGSLQSIKDLYSNVFQTVVTVSKPEVAEMMKLYENCQRMLCIAYANEMADACLPHGIDPFEVCEAASSKPFGYLPFTASLGVGGPCIPVNPYYLLSNNAFPLLQHATEKMWQRPAAVASRAMKQLLQSDVEGFAKRQPRVLVVGVGFKRGQSNITCSPGADLVKSLLESWHAHVTFADPLVEESALPYVPRLNEVTEWNKQSLGWFDLIMVAVRQEGIDFDVLEGLDGVAVEWYCR